MSKNDLEFVKLENDHDIQIRYVYHLSDIHIRNTIRHTEYQEVFARTFDILKKDIINKNECLIVVTGDIMHTKTELSPESFYIAQNFFKSLSNICSVVLIPGNHDCNLSNKTRMDALSPIVSGNAKIENLYYIKKNGVYQYHNIIFGVTTVFDDFFVKAEFIKKEIWNKIKQKCKYKIALYHGPVHGAKTDVGYRMNNDQLLVDDFDGYDYVMLGDIHKYQFMNQDQTIAYSGSLIQQSHGENLKGHGVLKWDLKKNKTKFVEIQNDYGFCTVHLKNGKMMETVIPKKPTIKFILHNTTQLQYQDILTELEKKYEIQDVLKELNFGKKIKENIESKKKVTNHISQEEIMISYLKQKKIRSGQIREILDLHKKLNKKINRDHNESSNSTKNVKWKILELKFTNVLSYGKDNIIDFKNYVPNKIIGIFAPNYYGKSAIIDIILFTLFDKFSRGERRDILNKNENKMYCSLLFSIGSNKYLIEKIGNRSKNGLSVKIDVNFYKIDARDKKENLNGVDKNETNKKIFDMVGDYNDYLTTCIFLQQNKNMNFIDMTQLHKKEHLNETLNLCTFEKYHEISKDKLKEYTGQLKLLEQKINFKSLEETKNKICSISKKLLKLENKKVNLESFLIDGLDFMINVFSKNTVIPPNELSMYDLSTESNICRKIKQIQEKLNQDSNLNLREIKKRIDDKKTLLLKLEEDRNMINKNARLKNLMEKKDNLTKKLKHPKNENSLNLDDLLEQQKNILEEIDKIIIDELEDVSSNVVHKLEKKIEVLEKKIKPVSNNYSEKELQKLVIKYQENEKKISFMHDNLQPNIPVNDLRKIILIREALESHLEENLELLHKYSYGDSRENDDLILKIKNNDQEMYDYNNNCISKAETIINGNHDIDVFGLLSKSKDLLKKIELMYFDYFTIHENKIIQNKILKKKTKLKNLLMQKENYNKNQFLEQKKLFLQKENKNIEEKINLVRDYINDCQIITEHNKKYSEKIKKTKLIIVELMKEEEVINEKIEIIKKKLTKEEIIYSKCEQNIKEQELLVKHHKLLNDYHLAFFSQSQKNDLLKKYNSQKTEYMNELKSINEKIEKKRIKIKISKKELEEHIKLRNEFDEISKMVNLYQIYTQMMCYNGLPYEILKYYLPLIETNVNQILHSMIDFSIEFVFYDEKHLKEQKSKNTKINVGCVDINICHQNLKPYNINLCSGFERFIVNLAMRMTLYQISLKSKPNFFIIDEGWSSLDVENRNNIGGIINYIKTQYEHVIIISHLEELKNEADYIINIKKSNDRSHINNSKKQIINDQKNI